MIPAELAQILLTARAERRTIEPVTATEPLSLDEAYEVQRAGLNLRIARGERLVGWKLGYTSAAMREQMGIDSPNFGPLTDVMQRTSGADVGAWLTQPRVEPEIAVLMGTGGRIGAAFACLEVVDSVYRDYRFTLADNTADGSSAGVFVLGPELPIGDLAAIQVQFVVDGEPVAVASGAAADGDPLKGVAWLRDQLHARGFELAVGDIVLTGGLTRAFPLVLGGEVVATMDDVTVAVRRTAAGSSS
jgi:2-keto-4-pentenoate hydratase